MSQNPLTETASAVQRGTVCSAAVANCQYALARDHSFEIVLEQESFVYQSYRGLAYAVQVVISIFVPFRDRTPRIASREPRSRRLLAKCVRRTTE